MPNSLENIYPLPYDQVPQQASLEIDSDIIVNVFGELGMHTRAAVSANSLPLGVAVEVDAIFEIH